jgi:hypothetical protein
VDDTVTIRIKKKKKDRIYRKNLGKPVGNARGINHPENGALRGLDEERKFYSGHIARNIKSESGLLES